MSTYRYFTTDLLTGTLRADTLPLHVSSFSRNLGGVGQPGTLSAYLDLGALAAKTQAAYLAALEPRKTLLWVLQDGFPIWAGIVWDWPHASAVSNQLPINAVEIGSLFGRRQVRANQAFVATDLFAIFRGLLNYTLGKTNGGVSALVLGSSTAGATASTTFSAANLPKVLDCLNQFAAQYNFEYAFTPNWDTTGTVPQIQLQLGYPTLRRPYSATNLQLLYPSPYITDYGFPRAGSASVNSLLATATSAGSIPWQSGAGGGTHGQNAADFASGYPLLEDSIAYTAAAITTQAQIDAVADGTIARLSGCTTIPTVTIGGGGIPKAGQVQLGDEAYLVATSPLHPADPNSGAPGLQQLIRIIGWTVNPPNDQQAESTVLALGGVTT